jgi:integrase
MAAAIVAHEQEVVLLCGETSAMFDTAAVDWLHHVERVDGLKPSTLQDYRYRLTPPDTPARKQGRRHANGRILRRFGGRQLHTITTEEIERWLDELGDRGLSQRTVNAHRQLICSILGYATGRPSEYGITENVAAATPKRREQEPAALDFYEPEEIRQLADAARIGAHHAPSRPARTLAQRRTRRAEDQRDATLYVLAAYAGLRRGELLALRWGDISFPHCTITIRRAWSAEKLTSPKSRRPRTVPLATQPFHELQLLRRYEPHANPQDLVFHNRDGKPLSSTGVRKRYKRARDAARLRPLRFHDLRHAFGSIAVREIDTVTLKDWMGHARLTTTERYLHAKPRHDDAARLDRAFSR